MTSGYILIGVLLILGGIVAVSGDRIGTRVGKARLSLFKLRPRQTATLATMIAGTTISASVLTLLFGTSEQLRVGVFDLQSIQHKLSDTKENLARALEQKDRVQRELESARTAQSAAKNLLTGIDRSLKGELLKQSTAAQNFKNTEQQLKTISTQRNDLVREVGETTRTRDDLRAQRQVAAVQVRELKQRVTEVETELMPLQQQLASTKLKQSQLQQRLNSTKVEPDLIALTRQLQIYENTVRKLTSELERQTTKLTDIEQVLSTKQTDLANLDSQLKQTQQTLTVRRAQLTTIDRQHQQLEREFQTRATQLKIRDLELKKLAAQLRIKGQGLASLDKEVDNIEQEYQKIRQGNVAILRNQVLAKTILKVSSPEKAIATIKELLDRANLTALQAIDPNSSNPDRAVAAVPTQQQVIEITPDRLTQLKEQIADRGDYVVRIFAIGNYVVGDRHVQVFIDATPNRKLFARGARIARVRFDPARMSEEQIRQQFNILLVAAQLQAKRAGTIDDRPQIGNGELITYVEFLERVKKQKFPIEIVAVVDRDIYTLGPLVVRLQAVADNRVLFTTHSNAAISSSSVH